MNNSLDQKKIIGENIKAARKIKGLSQRALAEKLGIAFQNLSVWENGKGAPSAKYLMKLSEILGISLDQLTSPSGFISAEGYGDQFGRFAGFGGERGKEGNSLESFLENEIPKYIRRELSENPSFKLIISYLEEILNLMRSAYPERPELRRVADSKPYGSYNRGVAPRIPLPPVDLPKEERQKWERNAVALLNWTQSDLAFWVPAWAMEKYCKETDPSSAYADNPTEVSKTLREYLEQVQK